ncbi:MAG: Slp family lipoprotein [Desulfobacteraceae bacterium]|nr:Slp family lipoprotein [Desulfobacteraceae bacterium]
MQRIATCLACLLLSLSLTQCASPIAKVYRQEAVTASFPSVLRNPENYKGDTVVWGGFIIETTPTKEGTSISILETPLGFRDKPQKSESTKGRFIVKTNRYLDPMIYSRWRKITVAGKVIGQEVKTNSKTGATYTYPVVQMEQLHLWPFPEAVALPPDYWWSWDWNGFWYGPY